MQQRAIWLVSIVIFLALCLAIGWGLGLWFAPTPRIGVVRFENTIDFATADAFNQLIEVAGDDPTVAAVVVEILSPGGYATSSESIYHTLLKLREKKPVVASIDGLAASGGYFMAVAANRIYAPASAYVGNVGTRGGRPTDPVIFPEELSSGPYKLSGGSRFDQIRQLELVAGSFVGSVVQQRSAAAQNPLIISAETVAEARIYLGSEALAVGMIDAEGGRSDAIEGAAQLAGLRHWQVVDLVDYLGFAPPVAPPEEPVAARARRLVLSAPPDTIFMLDDRIPLPGLVARAALAEHLVRIRGQATGSLQIQGAAPARSLIPVSPLGEE